MKSARRVPAPAPVNLVVAEMICAIGTVPFLTMCDSTSVRVLPSI